MAREFELSVPHTLPQAHAVNRVKMALAEARKAYGGQVSAINEEWEDNLCRFSMKVWRLTVSGTIEVGASAVEVRGKMPLGTGRYEEKAKALLGEQIGALLKPDPANPQE